MIARSSIEMKVSIRSENWEKTKLSVGFGIHQGSALRPYIFALVMDNLSFLEYVVCKCYGT